MRSYHEAGAMNLSESLLGGKDGQARLLTGVKPLG